MGLALLDYDGDGWLDVFCVQGGPFDLSPGESRIPRMSIPPATGFFEIGETAPSKTSPRPRASPAFPAAMGTASRLVISTAMGESTCS